MLVVEGLTKSYRDVIALDSVSLVAGEGQVTAVVGANGAGKTTLFSILAGIIEPDAGSCHLDGTAQASWPRRSVGYLAAEPFFYDRLTGAQTVRFERTMRGIDVSDEQIDLLLDQWGAATFAHKRLGALSQGMRKRVLMAAAFLGEPKLVVLDEPLNGLDVQGVLLLKDALSRGRACGTHILMCSHVLDFVQGYADRAVLLDGGRVIRELDPAAESLEQAYRREVLDDDGRARRASS